VWRELSTTAWQRAMGMATYPATYLNCLESFDFPGTYRAYINLQCYGRPGLAKLAVAALTTVADGRHLPVPVTVFKEVGRGLE